MRCCTATRRTGAAAALLAAVTLCSPAVFAVAHRPDRDDVVLERLSPASVALRQLRGTGTPPVTIALDDALARARHFIQIGQIYSDPRAYGYAQASLGPWWTADPAPPRLLVMRARILQFRHEFDAALAQLEPALKSDQFDPDAWLLFAGIEQVRGNVRAARAACLKLIPISDPLVGATCAASIAALAGRTREAEQLLAQALTQPTAVSPDTRTWAWTTLAELRVRHMDGTAAEEAFREALWLTHDDVYTRAAYADFLLDENRPREVRKLLGSDTTQADATLLRAAIAAQRDGDADAAILRNTLAQRFAEARDRGDRTHLREQARFALEVEQDAPRALELAQQNFSVQREPADARVLLESALAAGNAEAAQPARDWLRETGIDAPRLQALAQHVQSGVQR